MARSALPEHAAQINIKIINWVDYVGSDKNGKQSRGTIFTKIPTYFHTERRLDLPGDLWKFFFRMVYLAATQRVPGELRTDAVGLAKECSAHPESVLSYLPRLIELELIQYVSAHDQPRLDEIRQDQIREYDQNLSDLNLPGASKDTWKRLFEEMPLEAKRNLGITKWEFHQALNLAANNQGMALEDGKHLITDVIFENEIERAFPGKTSGLSNFTKSYCRLFLHHPRGIFFFLMCINNYKDFGGVWNTEKATPGYEYEDFKKWLYSAWWDWFKNPKTKKYPERLVYFGNNPLLIELIHNIYSAPAISNNVKDLDNSSGAEIAQTIIKSLEKGTG